MSTDNDIRQKAKLAERKAIDTLNREEGWVAKHPGYTTLIGVVLVLTVIVLLVKGCH